MDPLSLLPAPPEALRSALAGWYRQHRRDLPWRRTEDPYAIWVAEVMLQQTRVETALRYYPRFLERFPTVEALARADAQEVLALWEGLGYYRRALHLHQGARQVVERFGGRVPDRMEDLLSLPGVGRSTAGAILSIAYRRPHPVLDGNVRRVLVRLLGPALPEGRDGERALWACAGALVDPQDPGTHNQAMMEVGATVCLPFRPRCGACPLAFACRSRGARMPGEPVGATPPQPERRFLAFLLTDGGQVLLVRRPPGGLLGGLWDLPTCPDDGTPPPEAVARLTGQAPPALQDLATLRRTYSHFRGVYRVLVGHLPGGLAPEGAVWVPLEGLADLPLTRYARQALDLWRGRALP